MKHEKLLNTGLLNAKTLKSRLLQLGVIIALFMLWIALSIITPHFLQLNNLVNLLLQVSTNTIIGIGMTLVILTGGIDLSVGSVVAVCATTLALLHKYFSSLDLNSGMYVLLAIVVPIFVSLLIGTLLGFANGALVAYGKLPPFIMTFGMMSVARGLAYVLTRSQTISGFSNEIRYLGNTRFFNIPLPIFISIFLVIVVSAVLKYTKFGRYVYAFGGNSEALLLSGVDAKRIQVAVYVICSLIAGFSAIITVGKFNVAAPVTGMGYELEAIGAVIVGGTSVNGGRGTVFGTFIGALLIGTMRNGLNLLNVDSSVQPVVIGLVVIFAVLLDKYSKSKLVE